MPVIALILALLCATLARADDAVPPLSRATVTTLLEELRSGDTPDIYGTIYYPQWKQPLDGLRSVTAEAVAEHANRQMKSKTFALEVHSDPIVRGEGAAVVLKRTAHGAKKSTLVPAYLHLDQNGKPSWGFLVLPIPYQRPAIAGIPEGADDRFMVAALNIAHGFESRLYEFDKATLASFGLLKTAILQEMFPHGDRDEIAKMVPAVRAAIDNPRDPESLEAISSYGTDTRYAKVLRGWLEEELRSLESQLPATRERKKKASLRSGADFLKQAIRRIDLE